MSIVTTISPVYQISTSITYENQTVTLIGQGDGSAIVTTVNTGIVGPKGDIGPQGPEYQGDDLPDFTLIFDNKLI
jgi:hypothetical protein